MSNTKPAQSRKGAKKGAKGEAPDAPVLLDTTSPELARAFASAWTVDISRASAETTPRRAQALAAALKPEPAEAVRAVIDVFAGYLSQLDDVDSVMGRDSKTPKERESRKSWQSRLAGVGIVAHGVRLASDQADGTLAGLLPGCASEMVRDEIVKALLGDAGFGTKPGALEPLAAYLDDPACRDVALLRAGFQSLFTLDPEKARRRWRLALTAPDVADARSVWLAKIAFEQMEAHNAEVGDLARVVFPLIKLPKGRGDDLRAAAIRYAGLTRRHYAALLDYVASEDDDSALIDTVVERLHWASLGAGGIKPGDVRPAFKALELRYRTSGDGVRTAVFSKLIAALPREEAAPS